MKKISILFMVLSFLCSGAMAQTININFPESALCLYEELQEKAEVASEVAYEGPSSMSEKKESVVYDSPTQQKPEPGLGYDPGSGFAYEQSKEEQLYIKTRKDLQTIEDFIDILSSYEVEGDQRAEQVSVVMDVLLNIYQSYLNTMGEIDMDLELYIKK